MIGTPAVADKGIRRNLLVARIRVERPVARWLRLLAPLRDYHSPLTRVVQRISETVIRLAARRQRRFKFPIDAHNIELWHNTPIDR